SVLDHSPVSLYLLFLFFFYTDTASTDISTLSLHDALPISFVGLAELDLHPAERRRTQRRVEGLWHGRASEIRLGKSLTERFRKRDRKSTRLNSSHVAISYAVFCLKKKKKKKTKTKQNNK